MIMYQERSASSERPTMFEAIIDEETPLFRDSIVNFSTADDAPVRPSLRPLGRAMTEVTGQRLTLVQLRKNSLPLPSLRRPSGIEIDGHKLRHDLDRMKYLQMGLGLEPEPLQPLLPVAKEGYGTTTRRDESASPLSHKTGKSTDIPHSKFRAGVSNTKFCLVFGVIMAGYFVSRPHHQHCNFLIVSGCLLRRYTDGFEPSGYYFLFSCLELGVMALHRVPIDVDRFPTTIRTGFGYHRSPARVCFQLDCFWFDHSVVRSCR